MVIMLRVALLNGRSKNYDKDISKILQTFINAGVISGLNISTGAIQPGYWFIQLTRTSGEVFFSLIEVTSAITIDVTGTKKVWIDIAQAKIDDGSTNAIDGTGIAEVKTGASYPASNFIKIAGIVGGVVTDEREVRTIKYSAMKELTDWIASQNFTSQSYVDSEIASAMVEAGAIAHIVDKDTYRPGEAVTIRDFLFDEDAPVFTHGSLVTDNGSSFVSTQSVTRPNTRWVRIFSKKKQRLVTVTKSASCTGTYLSFRTDAGVEIVQVPFVGNDATFTGLIIDESTYYRMEVGHSTTYTEHYNTYTYPFNGTNVNITNGSVNNVNDAYRHNIININTREENIVVTALNVWDVTANTRQYIPLFISNTFDVDFQAILEKIVSPSVNLNFRLETDSNGPTGALVDPNATATIIPGSVDTLYSLKTLPRAGSFTPPAEGTKCRLCIYQGTYGSETINATNYYKIYVWVNNTSTRSALRYDGSIYKKISSASVNDVDNITFSTTSAGANTRGYRIQAVENLLITKINKSSTCNATRALIKSDWWATLQTVTFSGNIATLTTPVEVYKNQFIRVELDNAGASYTSHRLLTATFPQNRTNIKYISWSEDGVTSTTAFNIDSIDTELLVNNFPCVMSDMFLGTLLSKTDAKYTYKLPKNWVCRIAKESKNAGENITCAMLWLVDGFTNITKDVVYNISDTPGLISTVAGTNLYKVWKWRSSQKLFISSLPVL